MKETIQQSGSEVSIVIYDAPLPPRYFRFSKKLIKSLFVTVPLLLVILLGSLFLWGLGSKVYQSPRPALPQVLNAVDSKVVGLEAEIKALKESNDSLVNKLSVTSANQLAGAEDPFLLAIKKPYGMQNLTTENKVSLDQFTLAQDGNKVSLKFQIISSGSENKVMGHVIALMVSESGIMAYPKSANQEIGQGIKYSSGEPFSVSRLRPTNAEFLHNLVGANVKFVIYIFSREGDLLLIKETESFKVGAKS